MYFLKFLVIGSIIGLGSAAESNPKFTMIRDRLDGEVPSVSIVFPDGSTDTIALRKYYSNNQDRMAEVDNCNFIGHLRKVCNIFSTLFSKNGSNNPKVDFLLN